MHSAETAKFNDSSCIKEILKNTIKKSIMCFHVLSLSGAKTHATTFKKRSRLEAGAQQGLKTEANAFKVVAHYFAPDEKEQALSKRV